MQNGQTMSVRTKIADLWSGRLPLRTVFWEYAVVYGLVVNAAATGSGLIAYSAGAHWWLSIVLFVLPLLYYSFITVAVWRSAADYRGSQIWSELARGGVVILALSTVLL
jgi:hypothetical protein